MDSAMLPLRFSRRPVAARGLRIRTDRGLVPDSGFAVALLLGARQRGSELGVGGAAEGRSGVSALDCYSPAPATRVRSRTSQRVPLVARVPSFRPVVDSGGLLAVLCDCCRSLGRCSRTTRSGRWRSYGSIRPVLKHGPRSLTCARVFG